MSDRSPRTSQGTTLAATGRYLSIDAEDIVVAAAELHKTQVPAGYKDNFAGDVRRTLDVLEDTGARATFFVNGRYCEANHDVMEDVVARGHVLATHGHRHLDVRELTVAEFNDDLRRSLDALCRYQDTIIGYRPPAFTMPFDDDHLRVLVDNGIKYVSCGALFQRADVPHHDTPARLPCGLVYIPVSIVYRLGRLLRYPVGYGHVSRLLPERLVLANLRRFERRAGFFQFYFHPYELNGIRPAQKKALIAVNRKDIPQRIYSLRCSDRSRLFSRILSTCRFQPLETMEVLWNGTRMESRIR